MRSYNYKNSICSKFITAAQDGKLTKFINNVSLVWFFCGKTAFWEANRLH